MENNQNAVQEDKGKRIKTKKEKINDFLIGFLGIPFVNSLVISVWNLLPESLDLMDSSMIWILSGPQVLINIGLLVYLFKTNKKYIAIGFISALVLPLLFFGGCFLMFATGAWTL